MSGRADLLGCVGFHPNAALVTHELVDLCHRHDLQVNAFTVNDKEAYRRLARLHVDGVFTDHPDVLMREAERSAHGDDPA